MTLQQELVCGFALAILIIILIEFMASKYE